MRRTGLCLAFAAQLAIGAGVAAFAQPSPPPAAVANETAPSGCSTQHGSVHFDFEGASRSTCQVEDAGTVSILITPEHLPPINPSPWYAFRYSVAEGGELTVNLWYLGTRHRYVPKWFGEGEASALAATVAADGNSVSVSLPPGEGIVSGQPLLTTDYYDRLLDQLATTGGGNRIVLGYSHDQRPIEAVHLGKPDAPGLVILLGRQHPPEVTGAMAMDAFTLAIAEQVNSGAIGEEDFQFLIVPLLNPDGVVRGHWRANLGGVDINRDWGIFRQPETRAVGDWLANLPQGVNPLLMLDFHSTDRNLFYAQGEEATAQGRAFLATWLGGQETVFEGYPFSIEPRNANPGSGTSKNWFNARYGIPAFTYEVGDESDPVAVRAAARALAQTVMPALVSSQRDRGH